MVLIESLALNPSEINLKMERRTKTINKNRKTLIISGKFIERMGKSMLTNIYRKWGHKTALMTSHDVFEEAGLPI